MVRRRRLANTPATAMPLEQHPISRVEWVKATQLSANDYNPNQVQATEMRLLAHSLVSTGWIQPILTDQFYEIIDGFHRATLARTDKQVIALTNGVVPVVRLELSTAERMMLTIRINRAKGTHMAFRMADIVKTLINELGLSYEDVMQGIGANRSEVELLMQESVFKKLDVENHAYSKAWYPK